MEPKEKSSAGGWLAVIAAILSGGGTAFVFFYGYEPVRQATFAADPSGEHLMVTFLLPMLTDIGIGASILWAVAAAGFFLRQSWAYRVALTGCVLTLLTGFFPMLPMMAFGIFPPSPFLVWLPNVLFFFLLTRWIRPAPGWVVTVGFLAVLGMVWAFINGVACTHRMLEGSGVIYVFSQRLHLIVAAGWVVFSIAILTRRKWAFGMGVAVACAAILLGTPLTIADALSLGRFSLFGVSPIYSLLLLIMMLLGPVKHTLNRWCAGTPLEEAVGI